MQDPEHGRNLRSTTTALCQPFTTTTFAKRAYRCSAPAVWSSGLFCLERGADLHIAQLMPLPLTVSCFSKIQVGFTFLVPAHRGSPGQKAVKWGCVVQLMPLHPKSPSSLASFKSRLVLPFWYRLTLADLEKRSLNGCSSSSSLGSFYRNTNLNRR